MVYREKLADVEGKITALYEQSKDSPEALLDLSELLHSEVHNLLRKKKMGRVKIYQHWIMVISDRIIEAKQEALTQICHFGVF